MAGNSDVLAQLGHLRGAEGFQVCLRVIRHELSHVRILNFEEQIIEPGHVRARSLSEAVQVIILVRRLVSNGEAARSGSGFQPVILQPA